jgi:hypothetical protein
MQRAGVKDKPATAEKTQGVPSRSRGGARANLTGPRLSGRSAPVDSASRADAAANTSVSEGPSWEFSQIAMDAPARNENRSGESRNSASNPEQKHAPLPAPLLIGSTSDPLEAAAGRSASSSAAVRSGSAAGPRSGPAAPPSVRQALASPGRPLDAPSRAAFEREFQQDFSSVRLHSEPASARAAQSIGARAFTVGGDIVLGEQEAGRDLLRHELAHVVQQSSALMPWVQRQPLTGGAAKPRKDYVFLMGEDKPGTGNPFFKFAAEYFHAHLPTASFVDNLRSLGDLLNWISTNVKDPIGDLYIVSHGAEDGTLDFGLTAGSAGTMTVVELRDALHPSGGGSSSLQSVAGVIDAKTKIHIKGCDIGRTKEMLELVDEAFGGAGTVTAPTHEQEYSADKDVGQAARKDEHDKRMGAFTKGLPQVPPAPPAVDSKLTGDALAKAQKEHDDAAAARKTAEDAREKAIAGEEKRITPDLDVVEEQGRTIDALSGPMFQRPGTKLYSEAELQPEIDRLYGHLNEAQRKSLAKRLAAPDHGNPGDQQGQKMEQIKPSSDTFNEPLTLAEATTLYGADWKADKFTPKSMAPAKKTPGPDGTELEITVNGTKAGSDGKASDVPFITTANIPSDASVIAKGRAATNNPDRYAWRVERTHAAGQTTLTAVGERVKAYLHHGLLDASPHQHFGQPESNPDFYATSTFQPPAPPPVASGTAKP